MPTKSPSPRKPAARKREPTALEDAIRRAIREAKRADPALTDYAIAKRIGVAQSVVGRFLNDGLSLTLTTAGKLCEVFGLRLAPGEGPKNNSEKNRTS